MVTRVPLKNYGYTFGKSVTVLYFKHLFMVLYIQSKHFICFFVFFLEIKEVVYININQQQRIHIDQKQGKSLMFALQYKETLSVHHVQKHRSNPIHPLGGIQLAGKSAY